MFLAETSLVKILYEAFNFSYFWFATLLNYLVLKDKRCRYTIKSQRYSTWMKTMRNKLPSCEWHQIFKKFNYSTISMGFKWKSTFGTNLQTIIQGNFVKINIYNIKNDNSQNVTSKTNNERKRVDNTISFYLP